jgi:hypothetical protein
MGESSKQASSLRTGSQGEMRACIGDWWIWIIEIIDIECVLLSFLIEKKGILVGPRLLRRGKVSRGCRECELFFQLQSLQKNLYRDLKWKKSEKSVKKSILVGFFTKSNSSEQNIYRNDCLKINFHLNSNSIGMFYKYFNSFITWMKFNNLFKLTQLLFIFFYVAWAWGKAFGTIVFDDYLGNLQFIDN